jgi:3-hydroxybutyrate dehydrogenase
VVAIETADHGITCNAICPGWVMTPLVAQQVQARANAAGQSFEETKREFVAEKQPMARYTRPEDIGALAVFLAGDAADTITGASYSIDGGWTAQ